MGAWEFGAYGKVLRAEPGSRLAFAYTALKEELIYNGLDELVPGGNRLSSTEDMPTWGDAAKNRTKVFQEANGLEPDGLVGIATATELFRLRIVHIENALDLPRGTIGKKVKLESLFDPVAVGTADPKDTGIGQINIGIHNVTREQAFRPSFALAWMGRYIVQSKVEVEARLNTLKGARAAYNVGDFHASRWVRAGFPSSGGEWDDETGIDWFARAAQYIAVIDKQVW